MYDSTGKNAYDLATDTQLRNKWHNREEISYPCMAYVKIYSEWSVFSCTVTFTLHYNYAYLSVHSMAAGPCTNPSLERVPTSTSTHVLLGTAGAHRTPHWASTGVPTPSPPATQTCSVSAAEKVLCVQFVYLYVRTYVRTCALIWQRGLPFCPPEVTLATPSRWHAQSPSQTFYKYVNNFFASLCPSQDY